MGKLRLLKNFILEPRPIRVREPKSSKPKRDPNEESAVDVIIILVAQIGIIAMSFGLIGLVGGLMLGMKMSSVIGPENVWVMGIIGWVGFTALTCWFLASMSRSPLGM